MEHRAGKRASAEACQNRELGTSSSSSSSITAAPHPASCTSLIWQALLQAGAELNNKASPKGATPQSTPLHLTCANGNLTVAQLLLGKQSGGRTCDRSVTDGEGKIPYLVALKHGNEGVMKLLNPVRSRDMHACAQAWE